VRTVGTILTPVEKHSLMLQLTVMCRDISLSGAFSWSLPVGYFIACHFAE